MSLRDFLSETRSIRRSGGFNHAIKHTERSLAIRVYRFLGNQGHLEGQNVYEREWDVLVLLDACRVDLLQDVLSEYYPEYLSDMDTHVSPASSSKPWMERTFTDQFADEIANTVYVTANPFSDYALDANNFQHLDEVWRDRWDTATGTVQPRAVTDRAIKAGRSYNYDRLIVHYMQPHYPFLNNSIGEGIPADITDENTSVWDLLRQGVIDEDRVWSAYRENLAHVLDDIETLVRNLDAETVVVSSDHGNAVGEHGIYGHPVGVAMNVIRRVPWCTINTSDTGEYRPQNSASTVNKSVDNRLAALGYKES